MTNDIQYVVTQVNVTFLHKNSIGKCLVDLGEFESMLFPFLSILCDTLSKIKVLFK